MPYWINAALAATPAFLWIFFGLGVPWALALLPRRDWHDRPLLLATAFAFGPGLLTAWMFLLGTLGSLRFDLVFGGTVVMAAVGAVLAWRKRLTSESAPPRVPFAFDEKLLIALIAIAVVIRWIGAAFWPFTAYDALWVYGYEGRLYTLLGAIPRAIGYYPQFLPLQFTYGQLAVGVIDDHAARAVLIFLHVGSILAACVLGSRLLSRRAGIIAAALWALYPHVGEWSRFGDLEIPLTFVFTLSAAFFLMAWIGQTPRRRYALLAGLTFGIALWTKPTAGAFVWGVLLLLALDLIRVRFDLRAWRPRLEMAMITGIASAPLGVVWYVRNVALGHEPITLPPPFWQTLAAQSGIEFGWPLLALLILLAYLYFGPMSPRPGVRRGLIGLALVLVGLLPSILSPHRMAILEWLALIAGAVVLITMLVPYARRHSDVEFMRQAGRVGWALALALPYFVTWFISYSYHYRLSFAIVPLMILPTALILSRWIQPARMNLPSRWVYGAAILAAAITGVVIPLYDANAGWDWLWSDALPDDFARYRSGNPALMDVVSGLQTWVDEHGEAPVVSAPGIKRLPFFFPLADIRIDDPPTRFSQLNGVTYFIDSHPEGTGSYEDVPLFDNQVLEGLNRQDVMRFAWGQDDGIFRYQVYELHLGDRFVKPDVLVQTSGSVVFGNFVRFMGYEISGDTFWPGRRLFLKMYWHVLAPASEDYTIYVHLLDPDGNLIAAWDNPVARSEDGERYYTTLVWEPKEYISEERPLRLPDGELTLGDNDRLVVGLYNVVTGDRVPMTINGKPADFGYTLGETFRVVAEEP